MYQVWESAHLTQETFYAMPPSPLKCARGGPATQMEVEPKKVAVQLYTLLRHEKLVSRLSLFDLKSFELYF